MTKAVTSWEQECEEAGDQWDHTAVVHDTKNRLRPGHLPAIFTDAFASYESALLEVFGRRYPVIGRGRHPVLRWRQGLAYGQVKKSYKGGPVDHVEVRAVHGKAHLQHVLYLLGYKQINTSVVERHNGTSRLRNQRKVCKTLAQRQKEMQRLLSEAGKEILS